MHFTYEQPKSGADLQQGDILFPTPELTELINAYHPYYSNAKFTAYIVVTQSCDLVQRPTGVTATYIGLCAIKSFAGVLDREIKKYQSPLLIAAEAVSNRVRDRLLMFIEKMLNNNHAEYFYIHEDPTNGIPERSCAYLRLTISLKAEHYNVCAVARRLSLNGGFQAKLGWLVGNLYSRVGTEDWTPNTKSNEEWKSLLNAILEENIVLIDDRRADAAKKKIKIAEIDGLPSEAIREKINQLQIRNKKDEVIQALLDQIKKDGLIADEEARKLAVRLASNPILASLLK